MRLFAISLLVIGLIGCSMQPPTFKAPNAMTKAELEADLVERNEEWVAVRLQKIGKDSYTGSATTADGQTLKLTVTCTNNSWQAKWENADRSHTGQYDYKLPRDIVGSK
jgi:hypothetical protein